MQFISLILLLILNIYSDASESNTEEFDWSLTKEVLNNECITVQNTCNVILSPFVTKLSLSLLKKAIAANSKSDKELSILLPTINRYDLSYWLKTLEPLRKKSESNSLLMGSLIGLDKGASINRSYKRDALYLFNTEVKTYDFDRRDITAKTLNNYVSQDTKRHFKDIVTPDLIDGAQAIILNTIYFKAEWEIGFEPAEESYHPNDNLEQDDIIFMKTNRSFHGIDSQALDSWLVRLNFKGGKYAMIMIHPKPDVPLQHVINKLDRNILEKEISKMEEKSFTISLPKHKFESSFSMAKHIKNLGIKKIFTPEANIQKINSPGPALEVTDVVQNFALEFNEAGVEAYVAMDMGIMNKMDYRAKSIKSINTAVNASIVFCIMDVRTGVVLFSGKVV